MTRMKKRKTTTSPEGRTRTPRYGARSFIRWHLGLGIASVALFGLTYVGISSGNQTPGEGDPGPDTADISTATSVAPSKAPGRSAPRTVVVVPRPEDTNQVQVVTVPKPTATTRAS